MTTTGHSVCGRRGLIYNLIQICKIAESNLLKKYGKGSAGSEKYKLKLTDVLENTRKF